MSETPASESTARSFPVIRRVEVNAVARWLRGGWQDFRLGGRASLFYGVCFAACGWLMLLVAEHLKHRLAGLIGIAPAPDFTRWGYSEAQRAQLAAGEVLHEPNPYGPEPTPTYPGFFADAECHLRLDAPSDLTCPVRLLHGKADDDVPWAVSLRLEAALRSDDVQVTVIEDGDHRLSRISDIAVLKAIVAGFYR
jgi:pimeloyl-ACP methyl ester carboxylesterase